MSVRYLNNNSSNNTDVVAKTFPNVSPPSLTPWVRNPSWPACEANAGDNRVRGLYAVWPSGGNFIAMTVAGAYTVDYGDGTTTNYTSGSQANYEISYSASSLVGTEAPVTFTDSTDTVNRTAHGYTDGMQVQFFNITTTTGIVNGQFYYVINATANTFQISATLGGSALSLTNDGTGQLLPYRIATVTITPQSGDNLTAIDLFVKHNQSSLANGYSTGWLDLAIASSNITNLTIGSTSTTIYHIYLEQVRLNELGNILSFYGLFANLYKLESVVITSDTSSVINTFAMFSNCSSLQTVPLFNTASVTNIAGMFTNCYSLQTIPLFNTASVTNIAGMFTNCFSLQTIPLFNTASVTDMSSMFSACYNLQTVPLFNTVSVTNMNSMFSNCSSLQTVPLFNTVSVTTMASMFSACYNLQTVPLFNTASVTTMATMFNSCRMLQTVPLFNTVSVTNMNSMFSNCSSLQTVPLFNTASVTTMASMFSGCSILQTVPLFNTVSVTTMNSMFNNCLSLQTIPLFNTASVTNMNNMFNNCRSIANIPALITTAVTSIISFNNMFANCYSIARIEAKDFSFTFSVSSCKLSGTALDEIYTNLPTVTEQTITVTGNYGTESDTPSIATAKGWTVTG